MAAQTWRRLTPLGVDTWGYRLREACAQAPARARHGFLLGAGDFLFLAVDRPTELAADGSRLASRLRAILADGVGDSLPAATKEGVEQLLALELSVGRSSTGVIEASTLPVRVGTELLPAGETLAGLARKAASGEEALLGGSAFVMMPA